MYLVSLIGTFTLHFKLRSFAHCCASYLLKVNPRCFFNPTFETSSNVQSISLNYFNELNFFIGIILQVLKCDSEVVKNLHYDSMEFTVNPVEYTEYLELFCGIEVCGCHLTMAWML